MKRHSRKKIYKEDHYMQRTGVIHGQEYTTYQSKANGPDITTKPKTFVGYGAPLSSVCAGHVRIVPPELDIKKARKELEEADKEFRNNEQQETGPRLVKRKTNPQRKR